ncbi:MAG: hypothetical protein LBP54_04165 [Campylobacteraceae bacterium]|jgi:hypothetical protein|nr:hypothetical protein [Campylobacteraceae bacterium]
MTELCCQKRQESIKENKKEWIASPQAARNDEGKANPVVFATLCSKDFIGWQRLNGDTTKNRHSCENDGEE